MSIYHQNKDWKALRAQALRVLPRECAHCGGTSGLQVDHIVPLHKGGKNTLDNVQLLCEQCHKKKSNRDHSVYMKSYNARRLRPRDKHPGLQ